MRDALIVPLCTQSCICGQSSYMTHVSLMSAYFFQGELISSNRGSLSWKGSLLSGVLLYYQLFFLSDTCQTQDLVGMAMVFSLMELAQTWISKHAQPSQDHQPGEDDNGGTEADAELERETFKPVLDTKASGGRWHFIIGLVVREACWRLSWHIAYGGVLQMQLYKYETTNNKQTALCILKYEERERTHTQRERLIK